MAGLVNSDRDRQSLGARLEAAAPQRRRATIRLVKARRDSGTPWKRRAPPPLLLTSLSLRLPSASQPRSNCARCSLPESVPKRPSLRIPSAFERCLCRWVFPANHFARSRTTADVFRASELRKVFAADPKLAAALLERIAKALTECLQATRHKLLAYVERANNDESGQQVC